MRTRTMTALVGVLGLLGLGSAAAADDDGDRNGDRPPLDAAVDSRPDGLGECVETDPAWGLEPGAECVWAVRAHLDGDDEFDVTAVYRAGGEGAQWRTATWLSTADTQHLAVGPLLDADGQPLPDDADMFPYRIVASVDPAGDRRGAVHVAELTGANTLTLSWQTAVGGRPLLPMTYTDAPEAGLRTTDGGAATHFSRTVCTDVDADGTIDVVYVRGVISDVEEPIEYEVDVEAVRWNSDGTVTKLPAYEGRDGRLAMADLAELPHIDEHCQGADEPDVLSVVRFD